MSTAFETLITQMSVEERIAAIHRLTDSLRPMAQGPVAQPSPSNLSSDQQHERRSNEEEEEGEDPVSPATLYRCDAILASYDSDDLSVITVADDPSIIDVDVDASVIDVDAEVDVTVILEPDNSVEVLEPIRVPASPVTYDADVASMNCQQLRDAWALLVGKPLGLKHSGKLSTKLLLKNEIMRLRTEQTMKKMAQYDLFESAPRTLVHPSPLPKPSSPKPSKTSKPVTTPKPRRKLKSL